LLEQQTQNECGSMRYSQSMLVIGGAGFIGSHFVELLLSKHTGCRVAVVDNDNDNLDQVRHSIIVEPVSNIDKLLATYSFDTIINFLSPQLINCKSCRCLQIITDQNDVPTADVVARLSHCYGPRQDINSFIPKMILSALKQEFLTVYGTGQITHDWVYISDCCNAIDKIMDMGRAGQVYDVCSNSSISNIDIVRMILKKMQLSMSLIDYTDDVSQGFMIQANNEMVRSLGWQPVVEMDQGLDNTIKWFQNSKFNLTE